MINSIIQKGSEVIIKIEHEYPVENYVTSFTVNCPSEFFAKLMADNIQKNFWKTTEKIRKLEYEAGWSDAKKRKPKRTYFYSSMTTKGY